MSPWVVSATMVEMGDCRQKVLSKIFFSSEAARLVLAMMARAVSE